MDVLRYGICQVLTKYSNLYDQYSKTKIPFFPLFANVTSHAYVIPRDILVANILMVCDGLLVFGVPVVQKVHSYVI